MIVEEVVSGFFSLHCVQRRSSCRGWKIVNHGYLLGALVFAGPILFTPSGSHASCSVLQSDRFETRISTDISVTLEAIRAEYGLPALGAVLVDSDGIISIGADGLRVTDGIAEVALDELWHLGSNTKSMTATLYATFVQEGELSFDDPLPSFFPEIAALSAWQSVTIRDLLRHRSGVIANLPQLPGADPGTVMANRRQWAEAVLTAEPASPIGSFSYSNVGYVLVGAALESHTGQPWEALMNERLFGALGMGHCGFGPPPHPENAQGHSADGTPRPGQDNTPMLGPAGTVHCNLNSWGRYLSAHLAGPQGESPLLEAPLWDQLHQMESGYAMGWRIGGWYSRPGLAHDGSNTFWYARALVVPGTDRAFGMITNIPIPEGVLAAAVRLVETAALPLDSGEPYVFDGCSGGNDEQMYCFNLNAGSTVDVSIDHAPFAGQLVLEHYDRDGAMLGQSVGNATGVSSSTTLPAGRYVLRVFSNNFMPACPSYEILTTTSQ